MAGGDGSLAVVAAAAAAHELPFICVPAGTRNHFALDLGVDRQDVAAALDAFDEAFERRIDLAEVNGRAFLNNVSLGIYGEAVRHPAYRDAKVRTLVEAAERVLGPSAEAPELRLVDDTGREHAQPAVVLVSNNPYALNGPTPGPDLRLTAASWASSFSTHPEQGVHRGTPGHRRPRGLRPRSRARRHRWGGGEAECAAAAVHHSAGGASSTHLDPDILAPRHQDSSPGPLTKERVPTDHRPHGDDQLEALHPRYARRCRLQGDGLRRGAAALVGVERVDCAQLVGGQLEVEDIEAPGDAGAPWLTSG